MDRSFYSVEDFVRERLPELIVGKPWLHAVFATYNAVEGYGNGAVETDKSGLTVIVRSGGFNYSFGTLLGLTSAVMAGPFDPAGREMGRLAGDQMRDEANIAFASIAPGVAGEVRHQDQANTLLVIYAGLTVFRESIDLARGLRQGAHGVTVVVVSCLCDRRVKEEELRSLLEAGDLAAVVFSHECGARGAMSDILRALMAAWPEEKSAESAPLGQEKE
ncbi:hypothetical protein HY628_02040 [Candidatus Uhrbacteria bacterium]|nr:hypothetical protein [Candidatus Uhrbacteria bacterium]